MVRQAKFNILDRTPTNPTLRSPANSFGRYWDRSRNSKFYQVGLTAWIRAHAFLNMMTSSSIRILEGGTKVQLLLPATRAESR